MKRSSRRSIGLNSFTLVELLAVLAIILILAGVVVAGVSQAIKAAKRAKAANLANGIQTASTAYFTEYSVYPVPVGTTTDYAITDTASGASAWGSLLDCLSGNTRPSTGVAATPAQLLSLTNNTRNVAFMTLKSSDVDVNDAPVNPIPTGNNIYFDLAMDGDYDGVIGGSGTSSFLANKIPNFSKNPMDYTGSSTAGVIVWANCNGNGVKTNANYWVHTF